jgi:acetyl-CoA C-acetyltransferase
VIGGTRIPFCRSNTLYADLSNQDLMTAALDGLVDRFKLKGEHIDEVMGGAVVMHSRDWNLTRESLLGTKLAPSTPGVTMIQACGTSLQAALGTAAKIATGEIESGIACGSDTTSDAPIVFSKKFSKRLIELNTKKSVIDKIRVFQGLSPSELAPQPPAVKEPRTGLGMGEHCELMAQEWGISRQDQDQLAYESHKKSAAAFDEGWFDDLVVPCAGVYRDNNMRPDVTLEKLAELKPAFDKSDKGTLTAGNSTPLTDGAAAVLLASEEWARERRLPIAAYITYGQHWGNDFAHGDGLLMAPTIAVSKMLDRAGLTLQDFDFYEIHEAFAAQVLCTLKAWQDPVYCARHMGKNAPLGSIDRSKLNVKGSSIAVGHPFAATGARIIANLAKLLTVHGGRGLISVCTAGGMGVAAIMESAKAA